MAGPDRSKVSALRHCLIFIKESSFAFGYGQAMQRIFHSLSCLILALALTLTGPGGAGPAKGDMLIEICSNGATSMVWADADGNPVPADRSHAKCLDCLFFSAPVPGTTIGLAARDSRPIAAGHSSFVPIPVLPVAHLRPIPRGPPMGSDGVVRIGDSKSDTSPHHSSDLQLLDHLQVAANARVTGHGAKT